MNVSSSLFCSAAATIVAVSPLSAEETPQQICAELCAALQQEVEILTEVTSTETAAKAVEPLASSMKTQAALFQADNTALWNYISNTQGTETQIVELLQQLARQFTRLDEAKYFGCEELRTTLAPQVEVDEEPAPTPQS